MTRQPDSPSVEDINRALALYRGMLGWLAIIFIGGIVASVALAMVGSGVYFLGWNLPTWALVAVVVAMAVLLWTRGREMGRLLGDPVMLGFPIITVVSAPTAIAQRAVPLGMEWSGFFGPLRPARRR